MPRLPSSQVGASNQPDPSHTHLPGRLAPHAQSTLNLRGGGHGPQPPPRLEIAREAEELLFNFTSDVLQHNQLAVPDSMQEYQG